MHVDTFNAATGPRNVTSAGTSVEDDDEDDYDQAVRRLSSCAKREGYLGVTADPSAALAVRIPSKATARSAAAFVDQASAKGQPGDYKPRQCIR